MSALTYFNFFPYSWHYSDEELGSQNNKQCIIRIFGWNERNQTTSIKINDFNIPVWIEMPTDEEWTIGKKSIITNFFRKLNRDPNNQPVKMQFVNKEKLYYADIKLDPQTKK